MSNSSITVPRVRELEGEVIGDGKKMNNILLLKKHLKDRDADLEVRIACLHGLRRVFILLLESGKLEPINKLLKSTDEATYLKLFEYRQWIMQQFNGYKEVLKEFITGEDEKIQALAIRVMMEFVKRECYLHHQIGSSPLSWFGVLSFNAIFTSLLAAPSDLSVDILLMLREEVFNMPDCAYFALVCIQDTLFAAKQQQQQQSHLSRNALDLLRVISLPEGESDVIEKSTFLTQGIINSVTGGSTHANVNDNDNDSDDSDDDEEEEEDNDNNDRGQVTKNRPILVGMKRKPPTVKKIRGKKKMSRSEELESLPAYKKRFSKAWLSLLSLPLTAAQHKLVLAHLRDHVMEHLPRPLLLADYLTRCYETGGVVAVLALESLFHLILTYNLDYPHFYGSLYRLCNIEIFTAKFRVKFMRLLSMSLKSTNLPAYLVAAFIKRLAQLAIHAQTPVALFCLAQITWLLRKHPQCMVLIHRKPSTTTTSDSNNNSINKSISGGGEEYNPYEEVDLEKSFALQSSLWELELLQKHHLHSVATLAQALVNPASTSAGPDAPHLNVEDFIDHSYSLLIEEELRGKKMERQAALAFKQPQRLFVKEGLIDACFG